MTAPPDEAQSYLVRDYADPISDVITRRVYANDGRVLAFNGHEWWTVCTLTADQVTRAKAAIAASGLTNATDLPVPANLHDTADLSYSWRLDTRHGRVTNHAYPALTHPAFAALEVVLNELEDAETDA